MDLDDVLADLRSVAARHEGLRLLVGHGSRPRRQNHARSDWDFGFLGNEAVDPAALHVALTRALGTDDVDLVDLDRASALLRFEAARHGRCIYEATGGEHAAFQLAATLFWCDAEWVIRRAHHAVLAELST